MNKKSQKSFTAALKKNNYRKLKKSQFLVLCYNCGEKKHIHFNYSHLLKNDDY